MEEKKDLNLSLQNLKAKALSDLEKIKDQVALDNWKTVYLNRSSEIMQIFKEIPLANPEERPRIGQNANIVKAELETQFESARERIKQAALTQNLTQDRVDVTLPGRIPERGRLHIASQTLQEIYRILAEMGFQVYRSREVESDEYNFELLNIPAHHPARDLWDTFYTTKESVILRTHTSPGQIHAMHEFAPEPVRIILPGMVYRYEQMDASHEIQFNQVELLAVGENITFGDLRGTLEEFVKRMFGSGVETRLRPSYFPFTEPSAEMDMQCIACQGKGCNVCSGTGWLEILGCGMVHPVVLKNGGYDPQRFSGFAAGLGPERISMLRYGIDDIRNFWANDVRFLQQF
ncbi:MAG TPA: phenylalanine--tRNA ligase subunit alpha [Anaerolineaceae bacterium]|uniref:Phenylalanine--tRNA ligase alpha subunit n=1 Tax=Anaerolinea thermophila TaxID=167964 RepID=A0A101FX91_9CHLR|nr:MAG: Phenylalanine--tRNA ligase alpha subunit [Anaerolinea thermophila]HAF61870.1 phenylalanine--tRNA ligase subunit alpha [Anaerolineaceae bacterium]